MSKKIISVICCVVMIISSICVVSAATYSSSYYTEEYIVNRNGISYNGVAHRKTGFDSKSGYTLDGHISIVKPKTANFKHCAVDCVFTTGTRTESRYKKTVFNTPSSGVTASLSSEMVVVSTATGGTLIPKATKNTTNYKLSNTAYVNTSSDVTLYGAYWTYKNGVTYKVPSFVLRY